MTYGATNGSQKRRLPALELVLIAQVFITTLFVGKIAADFFAIPLFFLPWNLVETIEILASIGMLIGVISSVLLVRQNRARVRHVETRIDATAGEFQDCLERQFEEWN